MWDDINFCSVKSLVVISIIQQNNQYREFASCDISFFILTILSACMKICMIILIKEWTGQ